MDLPLITPYHCSNCRDIRPHSPRLVCLYCEAKIPRSYFPHKSLGKVEISTRRQQCWGFLACDPEVIRYYHWFLEREGLNLKLNSFPHISFIRGERPPKWNRFVSMDGRKKVNFGHACVIRTNGFHYWVDVRCRELYEIRRSLGLADDPRLSLHLTIGRRFKPGERRCNTSTQMQSLAHAVDSGTCSPDAGEMTSDRSSGSCLILP